MKKILLYSGGLDSWLIDKLWDPDEKVYVNMHTRYSENEISKIMQSGESVKIVDFDLSRYEREDAIIPLRNLYLIMVICNEFPDDDLEICLGATAGDRVLDKSYKFAESAENLLSYLYEPQHWTKGRKIKINLDYKSMTKTQIIAEYIKNGGDINEAFQKSFSCYDPNEEKECWSCKPCFRKFVSFALNGMEFSEDIRNKALSYIKAEILPDIESGTYGRAEEEKEIMKVIEIYENCN